MNGDIAKHLQEGDRELIVVGDRVLVRPESPDERTDVGLYLPQTVVEKEKVRTGWIVSVGPGIALPDPTGEEEPWRQGERQGRYVPMQAQEGDFAIFLRKAGIEIKYSGQDYLVVPLAAILLLLRDVHG